MLLNLLLSLIVGIICLMSWMFKRNLEIDKDTQMLVRKMITTMELLDHRVSEIEKQLDKINNIK